MAIDSALKAASVVGVGRPFLRSHWTDVQKGPDWRAGTGSSYASSSINQPPTVDAGPNQTVAFGLTVTLAGSASDDGVY